MTLQKETKIFLMKYFKLNSKHDKKSLKYGPIKQYANLDMVRSQFAKFSGIHI